MSAIRDAWTVVYELSPHHLYCVKPSDLNVEVRSLCPGLPFLPGLLVLFLVHVVCMTSFVSAWTESGKIDPAWYRLIPVLLLWALLVPADLKFRLQGTTAAQREVFDIGVVNWIGLLSILGSVLLFGIVFLVVFAESVRRLIG